MLENKLGDVNRTILFKLLEVQLYQFPEIYLMRTQRILHPIQEKWSETNRDIKEHCLFDSENDSMVT